jgi:phage terminase small subunit
MRGIMENKKQIVEPNDRLTLKQEKFAELYVAYRRPADAYARVYNVEKMSQNTIYSEASMLLRNPKVAKRINELRKAAAEKSSLEVMDVLDQWVKIATADPADLIKYRRLCCRCCYGFNNKYQWIDEDEYALAVARAMDAKKEPPSLEGGVGYIVNKEPHPDCKQCAGEGYEDIYITPTNKLSSQAKLLYAGLRKSRDGVQVLMRDQDDALRNIARFLGMTNKQEVKISTPNNQPLMSISTVTADQTLAARIYEELMRGNNN